MVAKERIKAVVDELLQYHFWFSNEMLKEEEKAKAFDEACREVDRTGISFVAVSGAHGNASCMKGCMKDTVTVINYLKKKSNWEDIETWQIAGAEAILKQCKEDKVIPFDLPGTLMGVFGMWEEIKKVI